MQEDNNGKSKKKKGPGRGWHGDPEGHAKAGQKGGRKQGKHNNPANFANDRNKARMAGEKGGRR